MFHEINNTLVFYIVMFSTNNVVYSCLSRVLGRRFGDFLDLGCLGARKPTEDLPTRCSDF